MSGNDGSLLRFDPGDVGGSGRTPLFVDTNAIVAYFYRRANNHGEIREVIAAIGCGEHPYYPLLTNMYVLDEVVSILLSRADTHVAYEAFDRTTEEETLRVLDVEPGLVDRAIDQFRTYDDQDVSLTDHVIAEQARDHSVDHVLTYHGAFRTLGFTVIP